MKTTARLFSALFHFLPVLFASCERGDQVQDPSKEITSFSVKKKDGTAFAPSDLTVQVQGFSITVPYDTDVTHLVPVVEIYTTGNSTWKVEPSP